MTDLTPSTTAATTDTTPFTPFVRVMIDKATGRTVVALDSTAAAALASLLAGVDLRDMAANPGHYSLDADDATEQSVVGELVRAGLMDVFR